jgi:outer membrane protein assembly factor BamB
MPLEADGVVYVCVAGAGGFTYSFNAADGALRWSRETGCGIYAIPTPESGQPILADGILYSGQFGLDPADGSIRWQMPLQAIIGTVRSGVVYATTEHTIYAIRVAGRSIRWRYDVDAPSGGRPAVFGEHVYVGDIKGDSLPTVTRGLPDTYALDASSGALRWRAPTGMVVDCSADEAGDLVYMCGDNAIDAGCADRRYALARERL